MASSSLHPSLPTPPFLDIPGVPNFRDLGGYATAAHPGKLFRRNLIYRSSEPSKLTPEGVRKLQELGIAKVYDLRSAREIESHNDNHGGKIVEWDGAERVLLSAFVDEDYSPEALALRFSRFSGEGSKGFVLAYERILEVGAQANHPYRPFRTILEQLATEKPPAPMLLHCSAGKDRTGVICAVLLSLCGVEDEVVAHEYSLTEAGLGHRNQEFVSALAGSGPLEGNVAGAARMVSARKQTMLDTLAMLRDKYGSVERYVMEHCGLSAEAVERLRKNLLVDAASDDAPPLDWRRNAELAEEVRKIYAVTSA
ncbi:hypothetical protein MAPG_10414 [Magnaporthiopsis poae ATCC 64411]|uniref:Tyrosine specific protein phosphatases domain-containing protein n=1 Tax=Magnaporthiopsis poae (strain ATCC 64411 / 73-15) TaxID=644358 RepID=A0A0C4ECI7_MAGP6|nr:hypothetical protein MAPG_10414 [Magnaporthiopsis poae ATCC 64411]